MKGFEFLYLPTHNFSVLTPEPRLSPWVIDFKTLEFSNILGSHP